MLRQRSSRDRLLPRPHRQARKTAAAGVTDHGILGNMGSRWWRPIPWAVKDRLNATNWLIRMLRASSGCTSTHGAKTRSRVPQRDLQGRR